MKSLILWLSTEAIYILKYERNWLGRLKACQGFTYRRLEADTKEASIADIWQTYDLAGYTPSLVVSGSALRWQVVDIPAETRDEALQAATWQHGGASEAYGADAQVASVAGKKTWYVSAYPQKELDEWVQAVEGQGIAPLQIDVLPAVVSRWSDDYTGTVYIGEEHGVHCIELSEGVPQAYGVLDEYPADMVWPTETMALPGAIRIDTGRQWAACVPKKAVASRIADWNLSLPTALLAAF